MVVGECLASRREFQDESAAREIVSAESRHQRAQWREIGTAAGEPVAGRLPMQGCAGFGVDVLSLFYEIAGMIAPDDFEVPVTT